jgi:DNA-directed RNA polymerase specialized sigma24 family protein
MLCLIGEGKEKEREILPSRHEGEDLVEDTDALACFLRILRATRRKGEGGSWIITIATNAAPPKEVIA